MKKYLIIKEQSNGYRCHCCRKTWITPFEMQFKSDEEALKWGEEENERGQQADDDYEILSISRIGRTIYGDL